MELPASKEKTRINEVGFSVLHNPEAAIADIIFVHGIQGHPQKTWSAQKVSPSEPEGSKDATQSINRGVKKWLSRKHKVGSKEADKNETGKVFWPLDLLPQECANARILTWGYDSKISHFFHGPSNQSNLTAHARNLLHAIKICRLNSVGRNFIFVAHSFGGIIVKDVIRRAAADTAPELFDIYTSTAAILFLGTPHRGSSKAEIAEVVRKIVSVSGLDTTDQNIRALQINSTELELVHELFMMVYMRKDRAFQIFTFQEAKGFTNISYLKLNERVVEPFSSSLTGTEPTQTINANHMSMCRFASKDDEGYKQISGEIRILIANIQKRKEQELFETTKEIANLKPDSPSQMTTGSTAYSLNETERRCVALLTQNISSAAEYKSTLPTRVEGTCQWILSNSQYSDWMSQKETCLLWICGYPGSGKTALSTYLLEQLSAGDFTPDRRETLCYFFCDEKVDTQRDGMAILKSIIHQLIVRRKLLVKYIKAAYDFQGPQFDQNFNGLWRIFIEIASDKRVGPISVIVDAIDECEETTRRRFLQDVVKLIGRPRPTGSGSSCIKFLVTSRPILGRQYTTNLLQIDAPPNYTEQDLKLVIQTKVEGFAQRTQCKPEDRIYLENALYSKADGTFLWVTLVLHLLEKSLFASRKDIRRIIDEMPKTLTETYERFLHGISIEHQSLAMRLLHFLIGSLRPLTLGEMRILMAIEGHHGTLAAVEKDAQPNIRGVIEGVLGPLVRVSESRIHLVHQTLKEFLLILSTQRENPLSALYGIDQRKANLLLADTCISCLLLEDFQEDLFSEHHSSASESPTSPVTVPTVLEHSEHDWLPFDLGENEIFRDPELVEAEASMPIGEQYALFDYSARHWAEHFSLASSISQSKLQESAILLSDCSSCRGLNWLRFYWIHAQMTIPYPRDFLPIVTASYFGHLTSLKILLHKESPLDASTGASSIYWASRMGHRDVVDLLLHENVDPDLKLVDGDNAFIAAIRFDHLDVVKCLIESGGGFISEKKWYRVNYAVTGGRTPLSIAAANGFTEIATQLLQQIEIEPDIADFNQWTPLFWSIGGKHLDVLKLLLADKRVDLNHLDKSGRNILSWAASTGDFETVKYLRHQKHLKFDQPDQNGRTALSWAAGNGHRETTGYLRRIIDPSIRDNDGRSALSWACSGGHDRVVADLIEHDRKGVDQEDVDGWTPLAWALFSQTPKTVQVLLDSDLVDVNKKDNAGRSALSFAAGYGYLDVVKILLKKEGIDVYSKDNYGQTPLAHATRYPDVEEELLKAMK